MSDEDLDPFEVKEEKQESGPVKYRSVSQLKQYLPELGGCPHQYYLQRRLRAWQRPAAWFPQGIAVHTAIEEWEKSGRGMTLAEAEDVFVEAYADEVNALCEDTPNFDHWFASGPYHGQADVERRFGKGLAQIGRYVEYYTDKAPGEVIWIAPDGTAAVELDFAVDLDGVEIRGKIDGVMVIPEVKPKSRTARPKPYGLRIRDAKSGKKPGDSLQLAVYAVAVNARWPEVQIAHGDYWMGETGKPTRAVYDLTEWTRDDVTALFHKADEGIKAESFDPNPEPEKCSRCSVATACPFSAG